MRILILDDEEQRHEAFAKRFVGHEVRHTWNAGQAIHALKNFERWDVVFLDHDLGEKVNDPYPREISGEDVTYWMVHTMAAHARPHQVIIHSHNPDGARRMENQLRDAGFANVVRWEFNAEELNTKFKLPSE